MGEHFFPFYSVSASVTPQQDPISVNGNIIPKYLLNSLDKAFSVQWEVHFGYSLFIIHGVWVFT